MLRYMKGLIIRGRDLDVVPAASPPQLSPRAAPRASANQQSFSGVWVSTLCAAVSARGVTVFVTGLSEYKSVEIYLPEIGPYRSRVALALISSPRQSGNGRWSWGFYTVRGGLDPGGRRLHLRSDGVINILRSIKTFLNQG